ncbi:MAG: hypothetical protein NZM11_10800 [Anaerolineales bacterium]|nr:hypothetical protein [Anaerolineales bacterium]
MESADSQPAQVAAEQLLHAALHLFSRLVCKRHRQDVPGRDAEVLDEVGDAVGEHARLAGAGAGQHQSRPRRRGDGLMLLRVEVGEEVHQSKPNKAAVG